jgi:transaldolase
MIRSNAKFGETMAQTPLQKLHAAGQSPWLDFLSRDLIVNGELERLMDEAALTGVTSNPTIFQKAISNGAHYDDILRDNADKEPVDIFWAIAQHDVSDACDILKKAWDEASGRDGYVSIEVDPGLAFDADATIEQAQHLHDIINKPNLYVKVPATKPGLVAIEEMISRGKSINVTLIFSLERHKEVMEAYIRGLERLVENGGDPGPVSSVASFFVSRVDTETDRRLQEAGAPEDLQGKLAIANAKLAYANYKEVFSGERWKALEAKGAAPQRCLWASTSTKNPAYRDVLYVEELIGPHTVNTMPLETIKDFQDHGNVEMTLERDLDGAKEIFERVKAAGVDYDDVVEVLEREGVEKFSASFDELLEGIRSKVSSLTAA